MVNALLQTQLCEAKYLVNQLCCQVLEKELVEKNERIGTLQKEIADRDLRADGLQKDISERNANIKALSKELED